MPATYRVAQRQRIKREAAPCERASSREASADWYYRRDSSKWREKETGFVRSPSPQALPFNAFDESFSGSGESFSKLNALFYDLNEMFYELNAPLSGC
jgi:hypothetical protein